MCWCQPNVRTPCCGAERCHEAARRIWKADELAGSPPQMRRGLPPGQECRWCGHRAEQSVAMPATRACPTCGGCGRVPDVEAVAPGTAEGERRYDGLGGPATPLAPGAQAFPPNTARGPRVGR